MVKYISNKGAVLLLRRISITAGANLTLQQAIIITPVKGTNFEMGWSGLPKSFMLLKVT